MTPASAKAGWIGHRARPPLKPGWRATANTAKLCRQGMIRMMGAGQISWPKKARGK
jgi:hypothetical protein